MGIVRWNQPREPEVKDLDDPAVRRALRRTAELSARSEIAQRRRRLLESA